MSAPGKKGQGKNRELRADFLLNFQRPATVQQNRPPYGYGGGRGSPHHRSTRKAAPVAFVKGRFVQSSFRLFVEAVTPDVVEACLSADSLLDWKNVRLVDLLCEEHPKCPICLEERLVVPKLTKCGHVYCAPCVMRYHMTLQEYNGKVWQRCPVCNEMIAPEDLTSLRLQLVRPLQEGERFNFVLAERARESTFVRLSPKADGVVEAPISVVEEYFDSDNEDDMTTAGIRIPRLVERGWHLGRLLQIAPQEADALLGEEIEALRSYRPVAISEGDTELLPSIDAAVELLQQKQRTQREQRLQRHELRAQQQRPHRSAASHSMSSSSGYVGSLRASTLHTLPDGPSGGWCCRYINVRESNGCGAILAHSGKGSSDSRSGSRGQGKSNSGKGTGTTEDYDGPDELAQSTLLPPSSDGDERNVDCQTSLSAHSDVAGERRLNNSGNVILHYQLADGRLVFLQPFFTRLVLHEFGGHWDCLPAALLGLRLERMHEQSVTEELRRRHRFLSHLPLGCQITFVEVDLRGILSRETKDHFAEDFAKIREQRKREQKRERVQERISMSRAAVDEERYYKSLNLVYPSSLQAMPVKDDFATDLYGRVLDSEMSPPNNDGPCGVDGGAEEDGGSFTEPTFAERLKNPSAGKVGKGKGAKAAAPSNPGFIGLISAGADDLFPALGGGISRGSGVGRGRGRGALGCVSAPSSQTADLAPLQPDPVPDNWDDDDDDVGTLQSDAPRAEDSCTEAAASSIAGADRGDCAGGAALEVSVAIAEDEVIPSGAAPENVGKKKKGRAAKATTIRLFG